MGEVSDCDAAGTGLRLRFKLWGRLGMVRGDSRDGVNGGDDRR